MSIIGHFQHTLLSKQGFLCPQKVWIFMILVIIEGSLWPWIPVKSFEYYEEGQLFEEKNEKQINFTIWNLNSLYITFHVGRICGLWWYFPQFYFFSLLLCLDLFLLMKEKELKFLLHFIQQISDWLGTVALNIDWGPRTLHFDHSRALGSLYTWIAVRGRGLEGCRYTCISES